MAETRRPTPRRWQPLLLLLLAGAAAAACSGLLLLLDGSSGGAAALEPSHAAAAASAKASSSSNSTAAAVATAFRSLQQQLIGSLVSPPLLLLNAFSPLPKPFQLQQLLLPEDPFPSCLHTPDIPALLEDARLLHPLLRRLKVRTFFRIFKMGIQQRSCSRDLLTLKADWELREEEEQQQQQQQSLLAPQSVFSTEKGALDLREAGDVASSGDLEEVCTSPERCGLCRCRDDEVPRSWREKPLEEFVDRRHAASFYRWKDSTLTPDAPYSKHSAEGLGSQEKSAPPVYVDLMRNPPGFTNYQGGVLWALLRQNLQRQMQHEILESQKQQQQQQQQGKPGRNAGAASIEQCGDAAKLGRVLSGMQSNISVLAAEYFFLKPFLGDSDEEVPHILPAPNVDLFLRRFALYPERLSNLFFTFSLLLKGVCRLTDVLQECSCETGNVADDLGTRADLLQVLNATASHLVSCNATFQQPLFRQHRLAFLESAENVEALLRCVSCEKCQLHGTIKLTALRLAAKSATEGANFKYLERNEVTAMVNALFYFAESLLAVERMQLRVCLHNVLVLASAALLLLLALFVVWRRVSDALRRRFAAALKGSSPQPQASAGPADPAALKKQR